MYATNIGLRLTHCSPYLLHLHLEYAPIYTSGIRTILALAHYLTRTYNLYINFIRGTKTLFRGDFVWDGGGGGPRLFHVNLINFNFPRGGTESTHASPPDLCIYILDIKRGSVCLKEKRMLFFLTIESLVK